MNDSLDKLIDRTETHYELNQSTISSTNDLDEDITSTKDTTTHHFDIQKARLSLSLFLYSIKLSKTSKKHCNA